MISFFAMQFAYGLERITKVIGAAESLNSAGPGCGRGRCCCHILLGSCFLGGQASKLTMESLDAVFSHFGLVKLGLLGVSQ